MRDVVGFLWMCALAVVPSAGCSDVNMDNDGGTGGDGGMAPQVVSVVPANGAEDVAVESKVSATVDVALDPGSVSVSSLTLGLGTVAVDGAVSLDAAGTTVTFTPAVPLAVLAQYTATLSGISSVGGAPLAEPKTWQFTVRDRIWGTAELVEMDDAGGATSPQVALDANGNGLAVWAQSDGMRSDIWANRYTTTTGWRTAERIETNDVSIARLPQVAMDHSGNAVAVWTHQVFPVVESDSWRIEVWANRYTPSGVWGTAERIETNDETESFTSVGHALVAVDANGNAMAVWNETDGETKRVWANRYTPSGGWETAELIEEANGQNSVNLDLAMDPNGNAVVVWQRGTFGSSVKTIWANRYTPSGSWGTAERIETHDPAPGQGGNVPQVALDSNGNGLAVWVWTDGTRFEVWANRYTTATGWRVAERIEAFGAGRATSPQVALDPNGNGLAVWAQSDGTRSNIWANRYTPVDGWSLAEVIETDNVADARSPQVALDPNGNGLAVWQQSDGTRTNIWANRYTPGGGWSIAEVVETDNASDATSPQVALDPNGNGLAVWQQSDGTRDSIWSNRYR